MAREYNWNVKNKATKGYEVCSKPPVALFQSKWDY